MRYTAVAVALAFVLGACATQEAAKPAQRELLSQKAAAARTRADHEELAQWYVREAAAIGDKAAVHRRLRDGYASPLGGYGLTGFWQHCNSLVGRYEQAAQDLLALARLHRELAAKAIQ
ncbi:MAG: hypothetical protein HYX46_00060 [Betaproteobacteria bacterium]|nr:hypothetical protein [Betaproteobacteria bacterium]